MQAGTGIFSSSRTGGVVSWTGALFGVVTEEVVSRVVFELTSVAGGLGGDLNSSVGVVVWRSSP